MADYVIYVKTGDRLFAGTDACVQIILHDDHGNASSPIVLDALFRNDFERGALDTFNVSSRKVATLDKLANIVRIELWKDGFQVGCDWFVDSIAVENRSTNQYFVFPMLQWIKPGFHYQIKLYDTSLPQHDEFTEQREKELAEKKKTYEMEQHIPDGPVQVKTLPCDEQFSFDYQWDLGKLIGKQEVASGIKLCTTEPFQTIDDFKSVFTQRVLNTPPDVDKWDDDAHFGMLRLSGVNHSVIELVKEIPAKFPVTDDMVKPYLEGLTIAEAIQKKRLFMVDLAILDGVTTGSNAATGKKYNVCAPIALFFYTSNKTLKPVAIQLNQKPSADNPIFTPQAKSATWTLVKFWFNNADAQHHQSLTHLGLTHLLMEGVAVISNRNLSQSHPIFKLLAPHFLYVIAINSKAITTLISPGGWVDQAFNVGREGMFQIMLEGYKQWKLDVHGTLPEDLKRRGLDDLEVLPIYYYRNDALLLYNAILKYVTDYVNLYYTKPELLTGDKEIQAWAEEMVKDRNKSEGGLGFLGVPGNGKISTNEELTVILTSIIYTCSVAHAATNFPQYDQYAFPPNYPVMMKGTPPTDPNATVSESDLVASLANREEMVNIMKMVKVLSSRGTKSLGFFEVQYAYDPNAVKIVNAFRKELADIGKEIMERNEDREHRYSYLNPNYIPNSISI